MEAKELSQALIAFRKEIGPTAEILCSVSDGRWMGVNECVGISIYPDGMLGKAVHLSVNSETFEDLLVKARAAWDARKGEILAAKIKKIALAVIRLTFERGECTDMDLAVEGFAHADVSTYGAEAVKLANTMAGNRPFAIVKAPQPNAKQEG